ncbi:MAG TPA: hypothetical protein VKD21_07650, partial [Acidimicrobiales bacterium]|nr:hypothetical protein [Acidimicrobiales bacterium]
MVAAQRRLWPPSSGAPATPLGAPDARLGPIPADPGPLDPAVKVGQHPGMLRTRLTDALQIEHP